uniref:NR LBD domain-containing protein n=1 Tax=Caenorhabditis japonica TaxID=281687 RepID=K7IB77_CAEJA
MGEPTSDFSSSSSRASSDYEIGEIIEPFTFDIDTLLHLQRNQRVQHHKYFNQTIETNGCVKINGKLRRRARAHDINFILKLGLENAIEWAEHFEPFRVLTDTDKKLVLSEFGFACVLIDQGFKTAKESVEGYWLLQNGTFMHSDYFLALPEEDTKKANVEKKAELHFAFINELDRCVSTPFRKLKIDEFECSVLKTVLLLTPSFPGQVIFQDIEHLHKKCMKELMRHSVIRSPDRGPERFGEIILLISSIRCGVKALYNQTRNSDIFHLMSFDPFVRSIFLP